MVHEPLISAERLALFQRDGFLLLRGLFDHDEMRDIALWTEELAARPETPGREMMYFENSLTRSGARLLSRIEDFCSFHAAFDRLVHGAKMQGVVSELLGEPAVLFKDKINFKLPGAGGFTPHQDLQAGWASYAPLHITAMVTIDTTTQRNGCLEVAAGHHRRGLIGRLWEPLSDEDMQGMVFEPYPTAPGDAMFFDSFTPHRSAPNRSDQPRRVLYVTYNRRADGDHRRQYYADKRNNYPPDCERTPERQYVFRV